MDFELLQKIFFAIKNDDIRVFSEAVNLRRSVLNLSFGRFPILSCCYLYGSEKIIANYERELIGVNYNRVIEFSEIYIKFKPLAKKCLRLYMEDDSIVSPMEMLAIMDDSLRLKKVFARYQKSEQISLRISEIYLILHKQKIKRQDNILSIKRKKLGAKKLVSVTAIIVLSLIMISLFFGAYSYAGIKFGDGSEANPIVIRNYQQFRTALEKGEMYYTLSNDVDLPSDWATLDFNGHINGNGHTINVGTKLNKSILGILNGSIENLNIKFSDQDITLEEDRSFFVNNNKGQISNVNLEIKINAREENSEIDINLTPFCLTNDGTITDSKIRAQIDFLSNAAMDTFLSGFASTNNGTINRCELLKGSIFSSDTVDIGGIVSTNGEKGEIINCKNYADITQLSKTAAWNPICGGIALTNSGLIINSFNYGKITASSENESGKYGVYAGGIAGVNKSKISKSKNLGEILAVAKNNEVYIGGVCGFNEATSAVIEACGNGGKYKIDSPSETAFMFGGGIVGGNNGTIKDCFNYGVAESDNQYALLCMIAGYLNYQYTRINNNVTVKSDRTQYFALTVQQDFFGQLKILIVEEGCRSVDTFEALKASEVYWE